MRIRITLASSLAFVIALALAPPGVRIAGQLGELHRLLQLPRRPRRL